MDERAWQKGFAKWAAFVYLLGVSCDGKVVEQPDHNAYMIGFTLEVAAEPGAVRKTLNETLEKYGIDPVGRIRRIGVLQVGDGETIAHVAHREISVRIEAVGSDTTEIFVGCRCPWPTSKELIEAIADALQHAGHDVQRPRYPSLPLLAENPVLDELRRRRGLSSSSSVLSR
jgi:hypothetical protein